MSGKGRRDLSETERAEWTAFTKKIAPLSGKLRNAARALAKEIAPAYPQPAPKAAKPAKPAPQPIVKPPVKREAPPLVPLERREKLRVARGKIEIEGRLDLHGHTQDEAHGALLRFLHRSSGSGRKLVLVITGKSGVLRRQVPLWLGKPEFRSMVIAAEPAGVRHGGEGALYVRLRRDRD
ncbi:MAG: Smr/MutS family protein [Pseudolabrys sp.]|nr:Smr/MutS family protein [Pseudolabrys sp.]MBV9955156.1 Smr/MutS family protein [Pseudolabrys sp.]